MATRTPFAVPIFVLNLCQLDPCKPWTGAAKVGPTVQRIVAMATYGTIIAIALGDMALQVKTALLTKAGANASFSELVLIAMEDAEYVVLIIMVIITTTKRHSPLRTFLIKSVNTIKYSKCIEMHVAMLVGAVLILLAVITLGTYYDIWMGEVVSFEAADYNGTKNVTLTHQLYYGYGIWAHIAVHIAFNIYSTTAIATCTTLIAGCTMALASASKNMKADFPKEGNTTVIKLQRLLTQHTVITKLAKVVEAIARPFLTISVVFTMPNVALRVFIVLSSPLTQQTAYIVLYMLRNLFTAAPLMIAAAYLHDDMSDFGPFVASVAQSSDNDAKAISEVAREYLMFMNTKDHGISCYGFFTITKSFLVTYTSAVFSLLVILLQSKQ